MALAIILAGVALAALLYISVQWRIWKFAPAFTKYPGMARITFIGHAAMAAWLILYLITTLILAEVTSEPRWLVQVLNFSLLGGLILIPVGEHIAISRFRRKVTRA